MASSIYTPEIEAIGREIQGGIEERFIKARLLQIAMKGEDKDSLKAIEMLIQLGLASSAGGVGQDLSLEERFDVYRILAATLRAANPEVHSIFASWIGGDSGIGANDGNGLRPDELPALREVGNASIRMGETQSGVGSGVADGRGWDDSPSDSDDAASTW